LGLETICRTVILSDALVTAVVEGAEATNGAIMPPTAEPLRGAPLPGSLAHEKAQAAIRSLPESPHGWSGSGTDPADEMED
jgi:hypothetical protein